MIKSISNKKLILLKRQPLVLLIFSSISFLLILLRLIFLQLLNYESFKAMSDENRIRLIASQPIRGRIFDKNGYVLADSRVKYSLVIKPQSIKVRDWEKQKLIISNLLNVDGNNIQKKYFEGLKNKKLSVTILDDLNVDQLIKFKENENNLLSFEIATKLIRNYPYESVAAHVIGYTQPITDSELKDLNKEIDDKNFQIPNDSLCLEPNGDSQLENNEKIVSAGDLSMIGLVPAGQPKNMHYATCDTVALLGERAESNTPIALPLPIIPILSDGKILTNGKESSKLVESQPFIVESNPRKIDFLSINLSNISHSTDALSVCGGVVIDMMNLPSMSAEELDGMLVAIRSLLGSEKPFGFSDGVGRIETLHKTSAYHNCDLTICVIEDETGTSESASLVLVGRSSKANLENSYTDSGIAIGFSANAEDLAKLRASGLKFVCCSTPSEDYNQISIWLNDIQNQLSQILQRLGLESIDSLSRQNLRALDYETAAVSGLRLSGYERPLPHWFAR